MPTPTLPPVVVTAPQISAFDILLQQQRSAPPRPPPEFERVLQQTRADSDFQRLLQKEFKPRGGNVTRVAKKFARKAGKFLLRRIPGGQIGDLYDALDWFYREYAKPHGPAAQRAARVANPLETVAIASTRDRLSGGSPRADVRARPQAQTERLPTLAAVEVVGSNPFLGNALSLLSSGKQASGRTPKRRAPSRRDFGDVDVAGLTSTKSARVDFSQPQPARSPKTKPLRSGGDFGSRGDCVTYRKPRPKCPARGYKLRAVAWEKVKCQ